MSEGTIIDALTKLVKLHKSLQSITERKTESIVNNDMEALSTLLKEEQLHMKAVRTMEVQIKSAITTATGNDNATVSDYLETLEEDNQQVIERLQHDLIQTIGKLKEQNDLNQALLEESLAFVQVSMDLLTPDPESYNYGGNEDDEHLSVGRSAFDSKA